MSFTCIYLSHRCLGRISVRVATASSNYKVQMHLIVNINSANSVIHVTAMAVFVAKGICGFFQSTFETLHLFIFGHLV